MACLNTLLDATILSFSPHWSTAAPPHTWATVRRWPISNDRTRGGVIQCFPGSPTNCPAAPTCTRPLVSGRFGAKSYEIGGSKYEIDRRAGFNVKYRMPVDTAAIYIRTPITLIRAIVCGREKGPRVSHFHELWASRYFYYVPAYRPADDNRNTLPEYGAEYRLARRKQERK